MHFRLTFCMPQFTDHTVDDEGYMTALFVDGQNILSKWGIEFSDSNGFFIHGQKGNARMEVVSLHTSEKETKAELRVHLKTTDMRISIVETVGAKKVTRTYTIIPSRDTSMQDISISQGFKQEFFHHMHIGNESVSFTGHERNHQHAVTHTELMGKAFDLHITYTSSHPGTEFIPMMYGRTSAKTGWIVHARLFPGKNPSKKAIVLGRSFWNKKIPGSDVLVHVQPLVDYLWDVGEDPKKRHIRTGGLYALGLARVKKDIPIVLTETITLVPARAKNE